MLKKIKNNNHNNNYKLNLKMGIKFKCPRCGYEKIIPKERFDKMTNEEYKDPKTFACDKCNIRMEPITVEVDF